MYLVVDFGGTFIKFGIIDEKENVIYMGKKKTESEKGKSYVLEKLMGVIFWAICEYNVAAVSLAVASPLDPERGILYNPPNLPGFGVFDLKRYIADRVSISICVDNDANLYSLGEYFKGAGRGSRIMVALTLGTGVGGGIVNDGRIWRGAHGFGGELGHITLDPNGPLCNCGNRGCLEAMCSARFLIGYVKEAIREGRPTSLVALRHEITGRDVYEAYARGDEVAREAFKVLGRNLGIGIASIANVFDPDTVVVGGGLSQAKDAFWDEMLLEFRKRVLPAIGASCNIKVAELGEFSALWGAYYKIKALGGDR